MTAAVQIYDFSYHIVSVYISL